MPCICSSYWKSWLKKGEQLVSFFQVIFPDTTTQQWCRNWGGQGGHWLPPIFGRWVNPMSTGEGRLSSPIATGPPTFFTFRHHCSVDKKRGWDFSHECRSHEWGKIKLPMSHEWLATSDKRGILPILSSYPSFNNIPDRYWKLEKKNFHQIIRKFANCEEK